jgi:nucleotide-binding universal stress UspA family protein
VVIAERGQGAHQALRLGSVAAFLLEHAVAPTLIARAQDNAASRS